jgi:DNA-binding MarR family transcriptional regulator
VDNYDRRVKRVNLSNKGTQMVMEMVRHSHEMSEQILDGLNRDARHSLADMLSLVKANLLRMRGNAKNNASDEG